jgi:homoserine kinase
VNTADSPSASVEEFAGRSVTVRVPATTANLGPGFDTLGLALSLYDELTVTVRDAPGATVEVIGVGAGEVPTDESNLVVTAIAYTFAAYSQPLPGLDLVARNNIPHGRGLGSSGAAKV